MSRAPAVRGRMMPALSTILTRAAVLGLVLGMAACSGPRPGEQPPDERFGHRYEGEGPDGRRTLTLAPPDSATPYFFYPAPFDTAVVRAAAFSPELPVEGQAVPVEVLVKGAFPDACSVLHGVQQERTGHLIDLTLEMRKPEGAICASVRRPYRFYVALDGMYGVGHYTLTLNGRAVPFEIRAPEGASR